MLVGLRKINQLLNSGCDLNNWVIEFESAEDIDIKYNGKVISRHQVKANKDGIYPNNYKDVLSEQTFKTVNNKKEIDTPGFQICNLETGKVEVDQESRFLHTITKVKGFELNEKVFKEQFPKAKYIANPNNIQLYAYPDENKYCELSSNEGDKILNFCKNEIKDILSRISHHPFKNNIEEHENIFMHLLGILDIQIREKHIKGTSKFPILKFEEIHDVIIDTTKCKQSNFEIMREKFSRSWTEFIYETQNDDDYEDDQIEKTNRIIIELYRMDDNELTQFIKDINPDKNNVGDFSDTIEVIDLCNGDSFKDIFYECLVSVTTKEFDISYKGYRGTKKDDSYLLTLINRPKSRAKIIVTNMQMNRGVTDDIFNREYLINSQINNVRFGDYIEQNSESSKTDTNWPYSVTENEIFYNPNLKFISVENAIEQLNKKGESS